MLKDFKAFILRGNAVDLAVGIIIGAAFTAVVNSLVKDLITPPIGLLLGNVDFSNIFTVIKQGVPPGPYLTAADADTAGAITLNWGRFINAVVSLVIVGWAVFLMVRGLNKLHRKEEAAPPPAPSTKDCPFCLTTIPIKATRCPHCTSQLSAT
jgi:large conductance mechanosensitive channel